MNSAPCALEVVDYSCFQTPIAVYKVLAQDLSSIESSILKGSITRDAERMAKPEKNKGMSIAKLVRIEHFTICVACMKPSTVFSIPESF